MRKTFYFSDNEKHYNDNLIINQADLNEDIREIRDLYLLILLPPSKFVSQILAGLPTPPLLRVKQNRLPGWEEYEY